MNPSATTLALFDQIPLGICVLRSDLGVRYWNACLEDWTGIDRRQIRSGTLVDRFEHLGRPPYLPRLLAVFEGGSPTIFSSQLHPHLIPAPLPDGRLRILHTVVTPIADEEGGGFDALLAIQEVTDLTRRLEDYRELRDRALQEVRERQRAEEERRRLEARMQQAQKLESLGVLAGGIAHDFNNLLVGILGNAELVLTELPAASESRRLVESVIDSAKRAAELSSQMLAYAGKGRFRSAPLGLTQHVDQMVELLKSSISKKATLRFELAPDLPVIEADAAQLRQVVLNLVTNASDALGEESGVITIATGTRDHDRSSLRDCFLGEELPAGEYVYLEISDTGVGMDEETREKIFDPFFSTKFAGRGLGLAAVLGIVRRHRGALAVESAEGRGTTFRIIFPLQRKKNAEDPAGSTATAEAPQTGGMVLVVDDEEMVRFLAQTALERSGFTVLTARDGQEGVEMFRAHADQISAVLLDMTMPILNGEEAHRELRRIRPDVKVIFSSGYDEPKSESEELSGKVAFIQKPYRPRDLVSKVLEVLDAPSG